MNNIFISCKESRIENNRSFYGCFSIGAFDAAQSLTIANALRRTLLSECSGLGIISVIIENVSHEYSTLPGMRESVLDLLLNLKEIVLKKNNHSISSYFSNNSTSAGIACEARTLMSDTGPQGTSARFACEARASMASPGQRGAKINNNFEQTDNKVRDVKAVNMSFAKLKSKQINCESNSFYKPIIGYLKVKGPGIIRAKDIKLPSFIQCVDPEQYIATLAEDGFLSMKILIMEGKGYLIQKNNSFIDYNLVKKRSNFLNELSDQKKSELLVATSARARSVREAGASMASPGPRSDKNLKECKPLNLDCIFNPVTKVSYIIEDFDNKVITDFHDNMTFINDISSIIESSHYLNKNFPYLTKEIYLNKKNVLDCLEIYTKSQIKEISNYLHPLKKQNSLHNIILEIWTNGSIHPREALYFGFQNISTTFLNLQLLL